MPAKTDKDKFDSDPAVESTAAARLGMDADKKTLIMEGWAALVRGDSAGALSKFEGALSADRSSVEAQYGQAATLKAMGRNAEAISGYQKTLDLLSASDVAAERVRITMLKNLARSALNDLQTGQGQPAAYEPPK